MSIKSSIVFSSLGLFIILSFTGCTKTITTVSLLEEMMDRQHLTYFPSHAYKLLQASSYNRASVSPGKDGWFANNDMSHFIRTESNNGRREFVMLDAKGPGAVVRWWMTFYKAQRGVIRVYIDGDTLPVLQGTPDELLSGEIVAGYPFTASVQAGAPLGEEGRDYDHNFYLPVPFAKNCKITYECNSLILKYDYEGTYVPQGYYWPDVFYNICYRAYPGDVKVESFSLKTPDQVKNMLDHTGSSLLHVPPYTGEREEFDTDIAPGDSFSIQVTRSRHAIDHLVVKIHATDIQQALRSTVLSLSFDGIQTVWVPIGEFFGSGYTLQPHQTWLNLSDGKGKMESCWVMPFQENCRIIMQNYNKEPVSLSGEVGFSRYKWKPSSMYFGASWHEYNHIYTRDENGSFIDLNYVDILGKGVYAGDQITLFNPTHEWWGEGDEKFFIDGEAFPSNFGTGSEDYYGYSFGRPDPFYHPFVSQPVGDGNSSKGITVNMRHRSLDAIPFSKRVSANIELWHWASVSMNYALTAFYYVKFPFSTNIKSEPESVKIPVIISGADF